MDARTGSSEARRIAVEDAVRQAKPDVVIPGAVLDAWVVLDALKRKGGPRIVYGLPGVALNSSSYVARHAASIDAAFGVSPFTARLLRDYCRIPEDRVFLVRTGVHVGEKQASCEVHRPIRLLYVGRFDPDKGVLDAVRLVDELIARKVEFRFTLVGDGVHKTELLAVASKHPDQVLVRPPVPQTTLYDEIYPDADAILLFSPVEGLPNAVLEGMSHGLVPIVSDFDGRRDLGVLEDDVTALVFPVSDVQGAANRIQELVRTDGLKERLGTSARQLIIRERSVERMTDDFVHVLERALEGPPRLSAAPIVPFEGRSRLRSLVGPRMAERIRKLLGRSFVHPDASEWPLIDNVEPPDRESEETRLRQAIAG